VGGFPEAEEESENPYNRPKGSPIDSGRMQAKGVIRVDEYERLGSRAEQLGLTLCKACWILAMVSPAEVTGGEDDSFSTAGEDAADGLVVGLAGSVAAELRPRGAGEGPKAVCIVAAAQRNRLMRLTMIIQSKARMTLSLALFTSITNGG